MRRIAGWVCLGLAFAGLARVAQAQTPPWKPDAAPPAVAGIHLGDSRQQLEQTLGAPSDVQDLAPDSFALYFKDRGVMVLYSTHEGATVIYLVSPSVAEIDGIHVGSDREAVITRWGMPTRVAGPSAVYQIGNWVVSLELGPQQTVIRIGLGHPDERSGLLP